MPAALVAAILAALPLAPSPPGTIAVDAFFDDWKDLPVLPLEHLARGDLAGPGDLAGTVHVTFSDRTLFVGVQVRDDLFQPGYGRGGDRLALVFAPAGRRPTTIDVVLNELEGAKPAEVRLRGRPVPGARVAGTTRRDGWAVELSLPLAAVPGALDGPVPFAAVVRDVDHDGVTVSAVVATAPIDGRGVPRAPTLHLDPAAGLYDRYRAERGVDPAIHARRRIDVSGDGVPELVVVNAADVVVLGRGLPGDAIYFYFTHGWADGAELLRLEAEDLDGRPGRELVVTRSAWRVPEKVRVEVLEIYGIREGFLKRMFGQQIAELRPAEGAELRARVRFLRARGPRRIAVSPARARKLTRATYTPPDLPGTRPYEPLPLPWETRRAVIYALEGDVWLRR